MKGRDSGETRSADEIYIPESSRFLKADYSEEPGREIIKEIREFVANGGEPHLWRGHTHNRPPSDARVKYLDDFSLSDERRRLKRWAVCPVCHPSTRHYGKRPGMIAWFPDEGIIRLIGPDCFKTLNATGHKEAEEELQRRKKRDREIDFLLQSHAKFVGILRSLTASHAVASALDTFGKDLRDAVYNRADIDLWRFVRAGFLNVKQEYDDLRPSRTGEAIIVKAEREVQYGTLRGHNLLNPRLKNLEPRFEAPKQALNHYLRDSSWTERVERLNDAQREALYNDMSTVLKTARELIDTVKTLKEFLLPVNIATLRAWGQKPEAPVSIYARLRGGALRIGPAEDRAFAVAIPQDMDRDIPEYPR